MSCILTFFSPMNKQIRNNFQRKVCNILFSSNLQLCFSCRIIYICVATRSLLLLAVEVTLKKSLYCMQHLFSYLFAEMLTQKERLHTGNTIFHCSSLPTKDWRASGDTQVMWNKCCSQTYCVCCVAVFESVD